ncbi:hypothetical protein Tco_0098164 [Tanacetum coccineum]
MLCICLNLHLYVCVDLFESPQIYLLLLVSEIASAFGICIGFDIGGIGIGIVLASALGLALLLGMVILQMCLVAWLHVCFTDCRCVLLPGYTSALQVADVFDCLVTLLLYRLQILQMCLVAWLHVWFTDCGCVLLPGYMSALQITDVFGSESVAVCCLLSAVCCLLSAVCCLLSAVCCLLFAVCCLLSAVCCCCLLLLLFDLGVFLSNSQSSIVSLRGGVN